MAREKKKYRELTVGEARGCRSGIPALKIQGVWFQDLGFNIGDPVLVKCEDGRIIISVDENLIKEREEERAFLEAETRKLEAKFAKEKKKLKQLCVAEREAGFRA